MDQCRGILLSKKFSKEHAAFKLVIEQLYADGIGHYCSL
jgi:hypothetical protein